MTIFYIDSSAWVKRYYRERGSDQVNELFASVNPRACSLLGVVEVTSALARKCKTGDLDAGSLSDLSARLDLDWLLFNQMDLNQRALPSAREVARRYALRGGDSVHMAALLSLRDRVAAAGHQVVLVASDRELKEAAQASGIEVLDPAD